MHVKLRALHEAEKKKQRLNMPRRAGDFIEFCTWYAAPTATRAEMGAKTQQEYAAKNNIAEKTLSGWKRRPEFMRLVSDATQIHAQDRWPEVMEGLIIGAKKGYADNVELYLNYFKNWHKAQVLEVRSKVDLQLGDIRQIIEVLPVEQQHEFYTTIARLLHAAKRAQSGGSAEPAGGTRELQG